MAPIIVIILLVALLAYCLGSYNRKQKPIKTKLKELNSQYVGKKCRFHRNTNKLVDNKGIDIFDSDTPKETFDVRFFIHKDSINNGYLPVKIKKIDKFMFDEKWYVYLEVIKDETFDFEIVYVSDFDAIAKSISKDFYLGHIYLPKREFMEFESGKTIKVNFQSRKEEGSLLFLITAKTV